MTFRDYIVVSALTENVESSQDQRGLVSFLRLQYQDVVLVADASR